MSGPNQRVLTPKASVIFITFCLVKMAAGGTTLPSLSASPIVFARNLFRSLNEESPLMNMLISPAAARSAMTLVFMGAGGKSSDELRSVLLLGAAKKDEIAKQHADFWSKECTCSNKGVAMRLVTRLYVKENEELKPDFNTKAVEYFNTQADPLNYTDAVGSMKEVNNWLEKQTFYTVRNLLMPAAFNPESSVILINSLYFRAKWDKQFATERTTPDAFWINPKQRMEIPMMRQIGQFRYGESRKLKARILQLPFEETDISMMVIVPQDVNGVPELEAKLQQMDLNEVASRTLMHEVDVMLPKFKIEFDVDLKEPLQKMGISRIFSPGLADLSGLFAKKTPQVISQARHKLYLDVNEAGCETDAQTSSRAVALSTNPERKIFKANRPFVFAIRNNKTVYFVGHFIKP